MNKIYELTLDEMDNITKAFSLAFPNRELTIIHEIESKYVHSDIGILYSKDPSKGIILFTMGMSSILMPGDKRCEIFVELPRDAFTEMPTCELCNSGKPITQIVKPNYLFIIKDLIQISKMPVDNELYKDGDTIETYIDGPVYGLRKIFEINDLRFGQDKSIDVFYLTQVSKSNLMLLNCADNKLERVNILSSLVKPIKGGQV